MTIAQANQTITDMLKAEAWGSYHETREVLYEVKVLLHDYEEDGETEVDLGEVFDTAWESLRDSAYTNVLVPDFQH